jgi:hypothetical protein
VRPPAVHENLMRATRERNAPSLWCDI